MTIITLTGPSAAGKSTVLEKLAADFDVLPERYMELNVHGLDNRLALSKWRYIDEWFHRALENARLGKRLLISDRSPLDTAAYAENGDAYLLPLVLQSINELIGQGIRVRNLLLTADFEVLMARTRERLKREPSRALYHEGDETFSRGAFNFYRNHASLWHEVIDTSSLSPEEVVKQVCLAISRLKEE